MSPQAYKEVSRVRANRPGGCGGHRKYMLAANEGWLRKWINGRNVLIISMGWQSLAAMS